MTAYVVIEALISDPEAYEEYKPLAAASVAAHGGIYRSRGGTTEALEGEPVVGRVVVLEFSDSEKARRWYHSDDYQAAVAVRKDASRSRIFIVEGYQPG